MKRLTIGKLLRLNPCDKYTDIKYLMELTNNKKSIEIEKIFDIEIPNQDKIWILIRLCSRNDQILLACKFARHVLPIFEKDYPKDKRPRQAIRIALKCIKNRNAADAADAAHAAHAAHAAADAAYAAAHAAAHEAYAAAHEAYAAAHAAHAAHAAAHAAHAADEAAYAAYAFDTECDAEKKWQLNQIKKSWNKRNQNGSAKNVNKEKTGNV